MAQTTKQPAIEQEKKKKRVAKSTGNIAAAPVKKGRPTEVARSQWSKQESWLTAKVAGISTFEPNK